MRFLIKLWFSVLILSMIFWYIPVYLFSNNNEEAVRSLKLKNFAPLLFEHQMDTNQLRSVDAQDKIDWLTEKLLSLSNFDTGTTIWDALNSNPDVKSVTLVFGHTPIDEVPMIDPLYGDRDIGLKFIFNDGSGAIFIFDAREKHFLSGHGAKVLHLSYVYRIAPDGRKGFGVEDTDSILQLGLAPFLKDRRELLSTYRKVTPFFNEGGIPRAANNPGRKVDASALAQTLTQRNTSNQAPIAQNTPAADDVAETNALTGNGNSAPVPSANDQEGGSKLSEDSAVNQKKVTQQPILQPIATQASPASTAVVDGDDWPNPTPCSDGWQAAYTKEREAQGLNSAASMDQAKEWADWCKRGYDVSKGMPPNAE